MRDEFLDRAEVGDQHAVESHFLAQDVAHEVLVAGGWDAVDGVERGHDHRRARVEGGLVAGQVHVAQHSFRHVDGVVVASAHCGAVCGEVLDACGDVVGSFPQSLRVVSALVALDHCGGEASVEQRILSRGFKHTSPTRVPH